MTGSVFPEHPLCTVTYCSIFFPIFKLSFLFTFVFAVICVIGSCWKNTA